MKSIYLMLVLTGLPFLTACGSEAENQETETQPADADTITYHEIYQAGINDAARAVALDSGSEERVNAILEVHAAEQRLRNSGFKKGADAYHAGAQRILSKL